jgi:hypothetical protein
MTGMRCVHNRLVLSVTDDLRRFILPAEEILHLALVLWVVEDIADRARVPLGILSRLAGMLSDEIDPDLGFPFLYCSTSP